MEWPMEDTADPIQGYALSEVINAACRLTNDIYGGLHHLLIGLISRFCQRVKDLDISFSLYQD